MTLRHVYRSLRRTPLFVIVSVLSIGMGTGMAAVALSFLANTVLQSLPYHDPRSLYWVLETTQKGCESCAEPVRGETFENWRAARIGSLARHYSAKFVIGNDISTDSIQGEIVDGGLFRLLGAQPLFGRVIDSTDDVVGGTPVVMLTYRTWHRLFNGDRGWLWKMIKVNGRDHMLIGVMPPEFRYPTNSGLYVPERTRLDRQPPSTPLYTVLARLPNGTNQDLFVQRLEPLIAANDIESSNGPPRGVLIFSVDARSRALPSKIVPFLMMGIVLTLIVTCINVSNLLLVRLLGRRHEIAIRTALGASSGQLMRQLAAEVLLIGAIGTSLGVIVALMSSTAIESWIAAQWGMIVPITINAKILLGLVILVTFLTGLMIGPIGLWLKRRDPRAAIQSQGLGTTESPGAQRLRQTAVTAQVALATVLVAGAILLVRSYHYVENLDLGYDAWHLIIAPVTIRSSEAGAWKDKIQILEIIDRRLRSNPATATSAAWIVESPSIAAGPGHPPLRLEGRQDRLPDLSRPIATYHVTPGFFKTVGLRIVRGRSFDTTDVYGAPEVVLVNETGAHRWWPNGDALGQRIILPNRMGGETLVTVIGVVADSRAIDEYALILAGARPDLIFPLLFMPLRQLASTPLGIPSWSAGALVGTRANPTEENRVATILGDILRTELPSGERVHLRSLRQVQLDNFVFAQLLASRNVIVLLAGVAFALSIVGVYGIVADSVERRRRQFAIMRALGASNLRIAGRVFRFSGIVAGSAIGIGVLFWYVVRTTGGFIGITGNTRKGTGVVFGEATDLTILLASASVIAVLVIVASIVPLLRAVRVSPMLAMRDY